MNFTYNLPPDVEDAARLVFSSCARGTMTWAECLTSLRILGASKVPLHRIAIPHHDTIYHAKRPGGWAGYDRPDDSTGARGDDE